MLPGVVIGQPKEKTLARRGERVCSAMFGSARHRPVVRATSPWGTFASSAGTATALSCVPTHSLGWLALLRNPGSGPGSGRGWRPRRWTLLAVGPSAVEFRQLVDQPVADQPVGVVRAAKG